MILPPLITSLYIYIAIYIFIMLTLLTCFSGIQGTEDHSGPAEGAVRGADLRTNRGRGMVTTSSQHPQAVL